MNPKAIEFQAPQNTEICWCDIGANGQRRYAIRREGNLYTSIKFSSYITEIDKLMIELAFTHFYHTSAWLKTVCERPKTGIYVRNGFHKNYSGDTPHITFCFQGFEERSSSKSCYYHANFDVNTRLIKMINCINVCDTIEY